MLQQVPGISNKTAESLLFHYKNIFNLINAIKNNDPELINIKMIDSKRRISKNILENLKIFLE